MKQYLIIKQFYGHSEQEVNNQMYIKMIVYSLNVLAQIHKKSHQTFLQINRYLMFSIKDNAHICSRKLKIKEFHNKFVTYFCCPINIVKSKCLMPLI